MTDPTRPPHRELVAGALREAMYYRGVSAEQLADSLGVSLETVRRWRRGSNSMSVDQAVLVAEVLNAPGDLFIRPPATREAALAMMGAWDELRRRQRPELQ